MTEEAKAKEDVVVIIQSESKPVQSTEKPISYWTLFRYCTRSEIILICTGILCASIAGAVFPVTTVVFGVLIDSFGAWQLQQAQHLTVLLITPDALFASVSHTALYFLYLAILSFVLTYIYMAIAVYTSLAASHRIRENYLKATLRQNIGWFDNVGAGEVATRITSDTLLIQDAIGEKLPLAVASLSTFISGLIIALVKSWLLTLVLLCIIPFIAVTAGLMNTIGGKFQTKIQALYSVSGNIAEESISAARTVTAFGAQKKISTIYNESLGAARTEGMKKYFVTGVGLGVFSFFLYCAYSLCFYYGSIMLANGDITTGVIVNVFFAVLIGAFALGQIAPDMQAFGFGIGAGTKIFATIDRVPDIDPYSDSGVKLDRERIHGRIELKSVEFTYPARPEVPILKKISLVIEAGQTLALVGQSGSGKSTIIQLLERFYDPTGGVIEMDGIPLKDFNVHALRQMIGLVSQEPVLFEGTVAENVAQGLTGSIHENDSWDDQMRLVIDACTQANAHGFISKLPKGYNTEVGEGGGQKQRVAIARAIIKDPKILLLDEATSALDSVSERVVQEALDRVSKSRTTIAIAHRLSTIKNADKIVVMVTGDIIESGNHNSLIEENGLYARLVKAQEINQKDDKMVAAEAALPDPDDLITPPVKGDRENTEVIKQDLESGLIGEKKLTGWEIVKEIAKLSYPELHYIIPGILASMGAGLIYPFFAVSFGSIINVFSERGPTLTHDSNYWALIFLIIAILSCIFGYFQNAFFGFSAELLTERLRQLTFKAIMRQDISFFDDDKNSTGGLTANLSSDTQSVQGIAGLTLGNVLNIVTNLIGNIIVSFVYGPKLAAVAFITLPILIGTGMMRIKILTYFSDMSKVAYEESAQVACESVAAIRTVQGLTRETKVYEKYVQMLSQPLASGLKSAYTNTSLYAFSQSANFLVNGLVFWYGGKLIAYENYSIQQFFTVFVAIVFGSQSAGRIFAYAPDMSKARSAGESIINLIKSIPKIDSDSKTGEKVETSKGHIKFENVRFNYPLRPEIPVLRGLNIEIKPGQYCALVGPSGCGKSTTIALIERFYDVSSGKVMLDGRDISKLNVSDYRNQIGLVSQEPNLFDRSIFENIALGCDYVPSQDEVENAARAANIHDFIMTLPDKYHTTVGAKGGRMSGGQKQRIAIARALIRNPKVLLLDESTSALDAESEKVVQEALDKVSKGRTTISIAHRLSTIQHADVIFCLKDGVVAEQGTAEELFKLKGVYYELAVEQNLSHS